MTAGLALAALGAIYAVVPRWELLVLLALPHGVAWSSVLTAGSAYVSDLVPVARRAEGIAYHGLASTLAIAVAPALGFALSGFGWGWLCLSILAFYLAVALLALRLPESAQPAEPRCAICSPGRRSSGRRSPSRAPCCWSLRLRRGDELRGPAHRVAGHRAERALLHRLRRDHPGLPAAARLFARPFRSPSRRADLHRADRRRSGLAAARPPALEPGAAAVLFGGGFSSFYPAFSSLVLRGWRRSGAAPRSARCSRRSTSASERLDPLGPLVARSATAAPSSERPQSRLAWPFFRWTERRYARREVVSCSTPRAEDSR